MSQARRCLTPYVDAMSPDQDGRCLGEFRHGLGGRGSDVHNSGLAIMRRTFAIPSVKSSSSAVFSMIGISSVS